MPTPILELPPDVDLPESTAAELNMRLLWIGQQLRVLANSSSTSNPATSSGVTALGTRNERLNVAANDANNFKAAQFVETDTGLVYVSAPLSSGSAGYVWKYLSGTARSTYSNPLKSAAIFVQVLDTRDTGLLLYLTDKNRTMRWTGTAWTFSPTEVIPIGFISGFDANPGAGWHICDGSAGVTQLNADGTTSTITAKDFTTAAYPKWGAAASGFQVAIAPGLTGSTASAAAAIQSGAANIQFGNANILSGTAAIGNDGDAGVTINNPASGGTPATVALKPHSHTDAGHTHTDAGHTHADSGHTHADAGHTHAKGTLAVDATAEPRHYTLAAYQRI